MTATLVRIAAFIVINVSIVYGISYFFSATYISSLITYVAFTLFLGLVGGGEGEITEDEPESFTIKPYQVIVFLVIVISGLITLSANFPIVNEFGARA